MLPLLHVTPCPWRGASFEKEGGVGKEETRVCLAPAGPRRGSHPWTALGQCSGRDGPCQSAGAWCYDSLALSCAENTKLLLAGGPVSLRCGQPKWEQRWRPLEWETLPAPLPREQLPEELPLRQCCARSGQATWAGRAVVACPVGPGCVWGPPSSVPPRLLSPARDPNLFLQAPPVGRRQPQPMGPSPIPINIDLHQVQLDPAFGLFIFQGHDSAPPGPWILEDDGHTGQHPHRQEHSPLHKDPHPHTGDETPSRDQRPHTHTRVRKPHKWMKSLYIRDGMPPQEPKSP